MGAIKSTFSLLRPATTARGSKVRNLRSTEDGILGEYWSGDIWIGCSWNKDGSYGLLEAPEGLSSATYGTDLFVFTRSGPCSLDLINA